MTVKRRQGRIVADESLHLSSLKVSSLYIMTSIAPLSDFDCIWLNHKPCFLTTCKRWSLLDRTNTTQKSLEGNTEQIVISTSQIVKECGKCIVKFPSFWPSNWKRPTLKWKVCCVGGNSPTKEKSARSTGNKQTPDNLFLSVGACDVQPVCHAGACLLFFFCSSCSCSWNFKLRQQSAWDSLRLVFPLQLCGSEDTAEDTHACVGQRRRI